MCGDFSLKVVAVALKQEALWTSGEAKLRRFAEMCKEMFQGFLMLSFSGCPEHGHLRAKHRSSQESPISFAVSQSSLKPRIKPAVSSVLGLALSRVGLRDIAGFSEASSPRGRISKSCSDLCSKRPREDGRGKGAFVASLVFLRDWGLPRTRACGPSFPS